IIYELLREFDGYTMDAEEEELVKVVQVEDEYYKIQEVSGYRYPVKMKQKQQVMKIEKMDDLLDAYNDYKRLADFFKDLSYEQKAEEVLLEMKRLRA
ncbi:histidinol dehydrogenase, partial [Bacillus sp. HC-Mk]